jgi:hypothetical protein
MSAVKDIKELATVRKTFVVEMTMGRDLYYVDYDPKTMIVQSVTLVRDDDGKEVKTRLLNWDLQAIFLIFAKCGLVLAKKGGEKQ